MHNKTKKIKKILNSLTYHFTSLLFFLRAAALHFVNVKVASSIYLLLFIIKMIIFEYVSRIMAASSQWKVSAIVKKIAFSINIVNKYCLLIHNTIIISFPFLQSFIIVSVYVCYSLKHENA